MCNFHVVSCRPLQVTLKRAAVATAAAAVARKREEALSLSLTQSQRDRLRVCGEGGTEERVVWRESESEERMTKGAFLTRTPLVSQHDSDVSVTAFLRQASLCWHLNLYF